MHPVRSPAVAGAFYPGDARALLAEVDGHLARARACVPAEAPVPKAVIAPHAGYVYSGSTAALAYARLEPAADRIERVVLLGPCHRVPVRGLAFSGAPVWRTPLGEVATDEDVPGLDHAHAVGVDPVAHRSEHSLEVHVPFLQRALGSFTLVPLAVGDATPDEVADALEAAWGGDETVVIASSDLSHYLGYEQARAVDASTIRSILDLDGPIPTDRACGGRVVSGLLEQARRRRLRTELLGACNSGDTAGDRRRVVGYASIAFVEERG